MSDLVTYDCSLIFEGPRGVSLWQGGGIPNADVLTSRGITAVIDLEGGFDAAIPQDDSSFVYLHWPIIDGPLPDLKTLDAVANCAIALAWAGHNVLTHCAAGINRSGLVNGVVVYKCFLATGQGIVDFIRSKRPGALSNQNFVNYLRTLTEAPSIMGAPPISH